MAAKKRRKRPAKSRAKPPVKAAISYAALATAVGVSRKRVMSAISRGEITPECMAKDGGGRAVIVNAERAEAELRAAVELVEPVAMPPGEVDLAAFDFDDPSTWPIHLAGLRTVREHHVSRQAKSKADLAAGTVVPIVDVRREYFAATRMVRDQLMNIPTRAADDLAAALGVIKVDVVKRVLSESIERALHDLTATLGEVP